jgi:AcrR family transcriptional regulator
MVTAKGGQMKARRKPSRRSVGNVRSAESEAAILNAAAEILSARGYEDLTIEAVARKAKASKPTIYRWWETKTKLISDAYLRSKPVVQTIPDLADLAKELSFYFENLWKIWSSERNASVSLGLLRESLSDPQLLEQYRTEYQPRREALIGEILDRGRERNELPGECDNAFLIDVLTGFHLMRLIKGKPVDSETNREFVDFVLRGSRTRVLEINKPHSERQSRAHRRAQ